MRYALLMLLPFALAACNPAEPDRKVGDDADAHGCRASAGYSWCAKTKQCERPWELAKANGFANTSEAFEQFCKG